jgi:hypothetical protein
MEIKDLQHVWQQQPVPQRQVRMGELRKKLRLYEQEEGKGSSLAGAIVMALFALAFAFLMIRRQESMWLILLAGAAFNSIWLLIRYRMIVRMPDAGTAPQAYLRSQLARLRFSQRMRQILLVLMSAVVANTIVRTLAQGGDYALTPAELAGIGVFAAVAAVLAGVLIWWYRTQHPWREAEIEREIREILQDWEQSP